MTMNMLSDLAEVDGDISCDFHSVSPAVSDRVGHSCGGNEGLGWHAADVEAIAAHKVVLYQSHLPKNVSEKAQQQWRTQELRLELFRVSVGFGPSNDSNDTGRTLCLPRLTFTTFETAVPCGPRANCQCRPISRAIVVFRCAHSRGFDVVTTPFVYGCMDGCMYQVPIFVRPAPCSVALLLCCFAVLSYGKCDKPISLKILLA